MSPLPRRPVRAKKSGRKRQVHPLAITGLVIVVTLFLIYYAFNQGLPFVSKYTLYAVVNNSVNVRSDSPVRIAGINVGSVVGTSPDGQMTKIQFTMQSGGLPIHTDATVTIRDRLFLEGGYYLQLDPGSPDAPLAHQGFTIQPQNTSSPVQFYKLLSTFDQSTRTSLQDLLNTANAAFSPAAGQPESDSGAGGLKMAIPQLTPLLKDVAWISQGLTGTHAGDVERLLSTGSDVTTTLNDSGAQLTDLITGLDHVSGALAATDSALAQTISGVDGVVQAAPPALTAIDNALPPVDRLASTLTPSLKVAPPLVQQVTNTVNELIKVVKPSKRGPLIASLRTTFTQFPTVLTQLGSVFPVTKAVTDCLRRNIVPVLDSEVQDGSLSTGQPVWKDFVHFLPNVAGATGNFDGDGHYTRALLAAGNNSLTGGLLDTVTGLLDQVTGGTGTPGGGTVGGAAPHWIGPLTAADFRPDVPCTTQAVPQLVPNAGGTGLAPASDLRPVTTPTPNTTASAVRTALARAEGLHHAAKVTS
ncbi:MAG TPA: MlaD family protein [Solirubrobacteraceae bacterium]|jgi:ABC-type transporter Mla subunit MlaD|nr:MlaD family protein [Solirubrobacteraceae bacterium]